MWNTSTKHNVIKKHIFVYCLRVETGRQRRWWWLSISRLTRFNNDLGQACGYACGQGHSLAGRMGAWMHSLFSASWLWKWLGPLEPKLQSFDFLTGVPCTVSHLSCLCQGIQPKQRKKQPQLGLCPALHALPISANNPESPISVDGRVTNKR